MYGAHQDSIVSLYGLKLISFKADGFFVETDSILKPPGKWTFTKDSLLRIQEGGRGFNPFTTLFQSFDNGTLQLIQHLPLDGEKIELVWHLKKIENDAAQLFEPSANEWRRKPTAPETGKEMRKRVASMLNYYSDYFKLIGKEAIYFSPARVPLPFRYYQHAIGLNADLSPAFRNLFYNEADAAKAFAILQQAMRDANEFPRDDNFVIEYGLFIKQMAGKIKQ